MRDRRGTRLLEILECVWPIARPRIRGAQRVETGRSLFALRLQAPEELRDRLVILLLVDQDAAEVKPRERIVRPVLRWLRGNPWRRHRSCPAVLR